MPDLGLPSLDDDALRADLPALCRGCTSFDDLRAAGAIALLRPRLTHDQLRRLDQHAPERIAVPSGSQVRLAYDGVRAPVLAVRIQEVFGLRATPRVPRETVCARRFRRRPPPPPRPAGMRK